MEFSNSSNKLGLVEDIDFLCRTTSASYPLNDKVRNINQAYHDVTRLIWAAADDWQYDDSNATDLPKVLRTMGHASASYQIPTTAQEIQRVEVKDSSSDWRKLRPIDYRDINISLDEYLSTADMPIYYDLVGNYVTLYPPPSSAYTTLTSGLALRVGRDVTEFTSASTTTKPGFATQFHRILSLAAAIDFEKDPGQLRLFNQMKDRLEKGLQAFYSTRETERRSQLRPKGKRRWRQYL